jgi:CheY-like chemotaxis protein
VRVRKPISPPPPPVSTEQIVQKENTPLPLLSAGALQLPEGAEPGRRKSQVLLVDDCVALIETMASLFSVLSNNTWEIHTASTPDRALAILQQGPMDLVVLDLSMPLLDGAQLLGIIHRRYPDLKKAVLSGEIEEEKRAICQAEGADMFIEKPKHVEGLKAIYTMLNDLVTWVPNRNGFSGRLREVGLHDVVQMECLLRNSSVLEVRNRQLRGQIYIEHGTILHASTGALLGEDALYELLALRGGEFQAHPFKAPSARTIYGQWESLLMEAARFRDETAVILRDDTKTATTTAKPESKPQHETATH